MQIPGCDDVRNAQKCRRPCSITAGPILMIYGPFNRKFFVDDARPFFSKKNFFFRGEKFRFSCFLALFRAKKWLGPTALQGG